ncbi:hypothetical protein, partial [Saccharothrix sp. ST-888]|uniref:hypothetical protein n=1 Tax=Saccharothrix sp. ST-888 TaxID=1427391 RepID=UPI0005EBF6AF
PSAGVGAARLARDKRRQREVAAAHGLRAVAHHAGEDPHAGAEFGGGRRGAWGGTAVGSGGSASVTLVPGADAALAAGEAMRDRGHRSFLAEEFLPGPEISSA